MIMLTFCLVWLRSSVVSVLFSLIAEISPTGVILDYLIFDTRGLTTELAHVIPHSDARIALPWAVATPLVIFFH
jgi:hypothetical protein